MTLSSQSATEFERKALEKLRDQYEAKGFEFVMRPGKELTPPFLGSYQPDAIASKDNSKIAIEVKQQYSPAAERSLSQIRKLFEGHPEWEFVISYGGNDPQATVVMPQASQALIARRLLEVEALSEQGNYRAAFVLGWALLEASLHRLQGEEGKRPRAPGTVVETLASLGYVTPETERRLRPLIALRNRIVHGDLEIEPTGDDVSAILDALGQALADE
ncbi:HepT-like ribonuclease domain-containing protein [Agrobacterium tumefaciens]|uniref:HepT-like ribonuclease domain-containing protein n=1 Tax=Agrobacterium tumefaciens TaxID=358 RepID=UPI0005594E94|nr:HepT-like ribonuclease domain-containing protein [Agrobacterium tumefaciens]